MPKSYACPLLDQDFELTGDLTHSAWGLAPWTDDFVDILGDAGPVPRFRTRVKMLWSKTHLYIGAEMQEPHVWGTLTQHDSVIFQDNDFEVFMDPDGDNHHYAEFEINALNTTWDLLLVRPYRDGGPAVDGFELAGVRTAVSIRGSVNDPSDTDDGWSVEIAIPFSAVKQIAGRPCPPASGDVWRINFSRVEWLIDIVEGKYAKRPGKPEDNWVWSPQGVVDMHQPEQWGLLQFVSDKPLPEPKLEPERQVLMALYHAQKRAQRETSRYPTTPTVVVERFEGTSSQWRAWHGDFTIDHESRLTRYR